MTNSNTELIEHLKAELELAETKSANLQAQLDKLRQAHAGLNSDAASLESDLLTVTHPMTIHNRTTPKDLAIQIGQMRQGIAVLQDTIRHQEALARIAQMAVGDLHRDLTHAQAEAS